MFESELESAICKCYSTLLPDLAKEGYTIEGCQVILLGRRIDILLKRNDGSVCIIELKVGYPPMPSTLDQILDYAECWQRSFPETPSLRLIVISTTIPLTTRQEMDNFGIESRDISLEGMRSSLEAQELPVEIRKGVQLIPDDTEKVRYLLSDFGAITPSPNLRFQSPWNHGKAFLALVKRGERHKDLWKKDIYVTLYPQRPNCAVLYGPKINKYTQAPLHLNPRAQKSWRTEVFKALKHCIQYIQSDNKGKGKEAHNFDHFKVLGWDEFAKALDL